MRLHAEQRRTQLNRDDSYAGGDKRGVTLRKSKRREGGRRRQNVCNQKMCTADLKYMAEVAGIPAIRMRNNISNNDNNSGHHRHVKYNLKLNALSVRV